MKLLQISQARSVWLFPLNDLNPRGKAVQRSAVPGMADRYTFAIVPDPATIAEAQKQNTGITFKDGVYQSPSGEAIAVTLVVYNDGILADTRSSTTDSDDFLSDLLTWLTKEMGLLPHENIVRRKLYVSDLYVHFERPLMLINPKLERLCTTLTEKTQKQAPRAKFDVGAIGLWHDPDIPQKVAHFRLERDQTAPFSDGRYFSQAPIHTNEHLELLEEIERLASV